MEALNELASICRFVETEKVNERKVVWRLFCMFSTFHVIVTNVLVHFVLDSFY